MAGTLSDVREFLLDERAQRRARDRAAGGFDAVAVVQSEVRHRLLERLQFVRMDPALCVDLGAGTGHAALALRRRYPRSAILAIDSSTGMLREARRRFSFRRRFGRVAAEPIRLPLRDGSVDLLLSNLLLHGCSDPDALFDEVRRVLRPGGLFSFTCLGPDTLRELRKAWAEADDSYVHVHRFIDMHDLGDGLVRAGLVEPVMDVERLTVTYATVADLVRDLRALGETNRAAGRRRGLTGRGRASVMLAGYERQRVEGRLPASCEVVFGQAWGPVAPRRLKGLPGEALVPVRSIGRRSIR
jgi:malonyl-CoA O-methyltransferase